MFNMEKRRDIPTIFQYWRSAVTKSRAFVLFLWKTFQLSIRRRKNRFNTTVQKLSTVECIWKTKIHFLINFQVNKNVYLLKKKNYWKDFYIIQRTAANEWPEVWLCVRINQKTVTLWIFKTSSHWNITSGNWDLRI